MGLERLACGYDAATVFLAFGYCLTSRRAAQDAALSPLFFCSQLTPPRCAPRPPRSLLSIINKFAVLHFPYPAALTGFQYAVSAVSVIILCAARVSRRAAASPRAPPPARVHPRTAYQTQRRPRGVAPLRRRRGSALARR